MPRGKKTKPYAVRLDEDDLERVQRLAASTGWDDIDVIRRCIRFLYQCRDNLTVEDLLCLTESGKPEKPLIACDTKAVAPPSREELIKPLIPPAPVGKAGGRI